MQLIHHPYSDCTFWGEPAPNQGADAVSLESLPRGHQIQVGVWRSTVLAELDFETYSEAGMYFDPEANDGLGKWRFVPGTPKGTTNPLAAVGAPAYAEHPSTELLSLAYDLKDGHGARMWIPGCPPPQELFDYLAAGGLCEAHNSGFEELIWQHVCVARMGWPAVDPSQWRCSMAKCQSHGLPGKLATAGEATGADVQKDKDGQRLLNKFSKPHNPTKANPARRITPDDDPDDGVRLYSYNVDDIRAEADVSARVPDLTPYELEVWQTDRAINRRGVHIDRKALDDCLAIVRQADQKYTQELRELTNGAAQGVGELEKVKAWAAGRGVRLGSLDADHVEAALQRDDLPPDVRRVLEIRASLGAASVKKLYAIDRRVSADGRLRDLFAYCGAERTGRWAGRGPQPQNLPGSGPTVYKCDDCGRHHGGHHDTCPWCKAPDWASSKVKWKPQAVEDALAVIALQDLRTVEWYFKDAVATVSGCLRGLFVAGPGKEIICSDYSAIEAVVLAALAGEEWRLEIFRTHGKIYEASAAAITGIPFEDMMAHAGYTDLNAPRWWEAKQTGEDHPMRKTIGKVAELASGYAGWIGAWKAFGADKFMDDQEIKRAILAWRDASPMIVEFWGGQVRKHPHRWEFTREMYGLEGAAVQAILDPGRCYGYRGITYGVKDDVLYCRLPSGRFLAYHQPRLLPTQCRMSKMDIWKITFMGVNSLSKKWERQDTYSGKLTENVVQAVARDIMANCLVGAERAGYPVVLHVHDEPAAEVPEGTGSIEGFERIMMNVPAWAADWPIKAAGGWRGKRYRKD